jgi:hemolysin activation/secretion protein
MKMDKSLSMRILRLIVICYFLSPVIFLAALDCKADDAAREIATTEGQDYSKEGGASSADMSPPKDAFLVKEVRIRGNTLISTAELLDNLPPFYFDRAVDPNTKQTKVVEVYDFGVLQQIVQRPGEGRFVSLETIQGLTKYILSRYREGDYFGVYVYVPARSVEGTTKLRDDILVIEVLEGRVAEITVERYDLQDPNQKLLDPEEEVFDPEKKRGYLKTSVLKSWSPIKEGDVIRRRELDDFVGLLNLNPDRYIRHYVSRSRDPNALNLSYDIYETNPWHWYLQADNSGTRDRQWAPRTAVVNTNLTGIDDRFSAVHQAPWEKGFEDEYSVFGSYSFPLFQPRLRLNVYAGYSQFDITPEGGLGINFLGNGSFYGTVLSYNIRQIGGWFFDVTSSLSEERSKVTPSLGVASDVDMNMWGIGLNVHRSDGDSTSSLALNRHQSVSASSRAEFELARTESDPDFTIYSVAAYHSQPLDPKKFNRISGSFRFITSDERLVPAKMTTFGGLYTVRGYEEDEIVADGGIIVSGQYEFDLIKYDPAASGSKNDSVGALNEELQPRKLAPLAFVDFGRAKVKDPVPGEKKTQELSSAGIGMIAQFGDGNHVSLYCGWPLRETDETDKGDFRLNVRLLRRF